MVAKKEEKEKEILWAVLFKLQILRTVQTGWKFLGGTDYGKGIFYHYRDKSLLWTEEF